MPNPHTARCAVDHGPSLKSSPRAFPCRGRVAGKRRGAACGGTPAVCARRWLWVVAPRAHGCVKSLLGPLRGQCGMHRGHCCWSCWLLLLFCGERATHRTGTAVRLRRFPCLPEAEDRPAKWPAFCLPQLRFRMAGCVCENWNGSGDAPQLSTSQLPTLWWVGFFLNHQRALLLET